MKKLIVIISFAVCLPIAFYGQTDGDFDCNRPVDLNTCNKIPNPDFTELNTAITNGDFFENNIPFWYDSHGTSDVNRPAGYSSIGTNVVTMAVGDVGFGGTTNPMGEGIAAKISKIEAGRTYAFSLFISAEHYPPGIPHNVRLNVVLINCQNFINASASYSIAPLTNPNQSIYCETLGTLNGVRPWERIFVKFTATHDFDMIRIYPDQTSAPVAGESGLVHISYPELIDITDFSTGTAQFENSCDFTIMPVNCGVKDAEYTWRDPLNNIVQQGPNQQLNGSLSNMPAGTYTLSMSVPGAVSTNNNCSDNNPVLSETVEVQGNCCVSNLNFISPNFMYLKSEYINYDWETSYYNQALSSCVVNNLCQSADGGEYCEFTSSSTGPSGANIWEARIYAVAPFTLNGQPQLAVGSNYLSLTSNFQQYSTSNTGDFELYIPGNLGSVFILEIRLTNSILNTSKLIQIKNIPVSGTAPGNFWCVAQSPLFNFPHQIIFGANTPGYNYLWTFNPPSGITILTPLTNCQIEFDVNYSANPTPVATLSISNSYGCPSYDIPIIISEDACSQAGKKMFKENNAVTGKIETKTNVYPNPAKNLLNIHSEKEIESVTIFNPQGRSIKQFFKNQMNRPIDISDLKSGTYFIKIFYNEKEYEVKPIIKL